MAKNNNKFSDVNGFLSQFDNDGGLAADYSEIAPSSWIHTGNYMFNAHISGSMRRGAPNNKIITIAGDPKTGKSFLVLNLMRGFIDDGYFFYFFETENAIDRERLESHLGAERMQKIRIVQPERVKEVTISLAQMTDVMLKQKRENNRLKPENRVEIPKIGIVIDSLTGLNSSKQYNDALEGKETQDMGGVAKELKELFNMMAVRTGKLGMPMICTAHVYEHQIQNFKERKVTGGMAAIYLSSIIVLLRKKFEKDKETKEKLGITVTSDIYESRYSRHKSISFYLNFTKGMNEFFGMNQYLTWDICGIDRGKMADIVDLGNELLSKKVVDKSNFTTKKLSYTVFKEAIAKGKLEALDQSIRDLKDMGYLTMDKDVILFTDKYKSFIFEENGKLTKKVGIVNKASNQWICRHLERVVSPQELFSSVVITPEIIDMIDVYARKDFEYGGGDETASEFDEESMVAQSSLDEMYESDNED